MKITYVLVFTKDGILPSPIDRHYVLDYETIEGDFYNKASIRFTGTIHIDEAKHFSLNTASRIIDYLKDSSVVVLELSIALMQATLAVASSTPLSPTLQSYGQDAYKEEQDDEQFKGLLLKNVSTISDRTLNKTNDRFYDEESCYLGAPSTITIKTNDVVNHPDHYGGEDNPYEVIKVLRAWGLTNNFNLSNVIKYIARGGKKENTPLEVDLGKAFWYLKDEIDYLKQNK